MRTEEPKLKKIVADLNKRNSAIDSKRERYAQNLLDDLKKGSGRKK